MPNRYSPKRRPIFVVGPSIAYLPLSSGQFALLDAEDAENMAKWNWSAAGRDGGLGYYAVRTGGPTGLVYMHRELSDIPPQYKGDHINRNSLDNRRANLRQATTMQNGFNRSLNSNNTLGYRGVFRSPTAGKFVASIKLSGKKVHIGTFCTVDEAGAAVSRAMKVYYGEYGNPASRYVP